MIVTSNIFVLRILLCNVWDIPTYKLYIVYQLCDHDHKGACACVTMYGCTSGLPDHDGMVALRFGIGMIVKDTPAEF